jgi:pyruvate dehydrogenase E2 component (dihydrolipoamide acetyltransferase)
VAIAITVPRLGWSMEEGTFAGWLKKEGEQVQPGQALFLLESDKATEEIEALDEGILRIPPDGPKLGDKVMVGQVLAHLVAEGEAVPSVGAEAQLPTTVVARGIEGDCPSQGDASRAASKASRRQPAISPRARRLAANLSIDCGSLMGTGRNGRIRERDVQAAGKAEGRLIPHTKLRRTIAARMVAGVTQAAPVTLTTKADATNLVNLRQQFKTAADAIVPGYMDMILKLAAAALRQHPLLQAQWRDEGLWVPQRIDIAMAVDTEAGLLAPVVRAVDSLTLREIAEQSRELIARARTGTLTADRMRDATFTITNLGSHGIDAFTPIIFLPQCAVLGVGRIVREPAVVADHIVPREQVTLSLTFDHRVLDGAPAAKFLNTLRGYLKQPDRWLLS